MNWINRFAARIGSAGALCAIACFPLPVHADAPLTAVYGHQTIRFTHLAALSGGTAIGIEDPGFQALLRATGSILTWNPGGRYVMITTGAPVVISFAVGDRRYDVGPISLKASFAPYERGDEVYLPMNEVLGALGLALRQDGAVAVLQPQLAALDVHAEGGRVTIVAHAAAALYAHVVAQSARSITYEFDGVGTTLAGTRRIDSGGVRSVVVTQSGTQRDPQTDVTVELAAGAQAAPPRGGGDRDVRLSFSGPQGSAPSEPSVASIAAPPAAGTVVAAPAPSVGPALVTGVTLAPGVDGATVAVAVSGNATFAWHRLRAPDNRFWVDIQGARLQGPPLDEAGNGPISAVRVRQNDANTVRVALSLVGENALEISPSATGLNVSVGAQDVADAPRSGGGSVGTVVASSEETASVTPAPLGEPNGSFEDGSSWKFAPRNGYVATNPRLIVIDPGHGGSDPGSIRNGVDEKTINLDMALRLRNILVAQGWQVRMTRDTDVDVYAPDDSAHQELQARVNVANENGARLFVSIHANAFINSGPYGTTCYISKPSDYPLARDIERALSADGTKDDGIVKSHLYVTLHTLMPAVLVETAFLSNPNDFALLTSPQWRQKVAQEMADGIERYTRDNPVGNEPQQ